MKTIKQIGSISKEVSTEHPNGAILNETDTVDGTPVVREIYNDHLVNNYKLLEEVGLIANGLEDNETNGYQLMAALKLLPNNLNDIERVLSLTTTVWGVNMNLDYLPNKYFFVARASEDYVAGITYSFVGTTDTEYPFTSTGFKASDELLVIIDQSEVRAYSLSSNSATLSEVFSVMGTPIAFNDTNKMWYQENGKLMSDIPSVDNLESIIRIEVSDGTVILNDVFVLNGYVLCFCYIPSITTYFFRQFAIDDLTVSAAVDISGNTFSKTSDLVPYVYASNGFIYVTNDFNDQSDEFVSKASYDPITATLTYISTVELDSSFIKTSNAVIKSGLLYTMISGVLESYNLTSGVKTSLGNYPSIAGQLFGFNGNVYFCSGEVCKKWF